MPKTCCGPGYASPLDAMKNGPKETLLYVVNVQPNLDEPHGDYLSTVDVDPDSPTYCQVIHRTFTNRKGNELHHSAWNACSSCHKLNVKDVKQIPKRDKLILPCLNSNRVYVVDVGKNPRAPEIIKEIDGNELLKNNVSAPHTGHCLANGNIMISTMGDKDGNAKCDFIVFDPEFNCLGTWIKGDKRPAFGYDYWYQPHFDVMVSSEWGTPKVFKKGFNPAPSVAGGPLDYGQSLNFFKWSEQKLIQTIDLGEDGITPLEVRFLHNPRENQGYVGCGYNANLYRFYKKNPTDELYVVDKVIDIPAKKVTGWTTPQLNGLIADILISLDDKYLYLNNWFHGDVRQYDISDRAHPKLVGQVFVGGLICSDSDIIVTEDKELDKQPEPFILKGKRLEGSAQMLQLSLDGKRLYVSTSLFSPWDRQFYPKMVKKGGYMVQIDVDTINGGIKLNENFLVDFGDEPYGPTLPHEIRYPGGDCTSDIWLVDEDDK